jgi:hypothetical protein
MRVLKDLLRFAAVALTAFATWLMVYGLLSFIRWDGVTCCICATVLATLNGLTASYQSLDTAD